MSPTVIPVMKASDVPHLTTEQMIEVDRAMMDDYRIDLVRMMENAGRSVAHLARSRFLDGDPRGRSVTVPPELYSRFLGMEVGPLFAGSDLLRLT